MCFAQRAFFPKPQVTTATKWKMAHEVMTATGQQGVWLLGWLIQVMVFMRFASHH